MKRTTYLALIALTVSFCVTAVVSAADFGTIKGRFVFKGNAPVMNKLLVTKDKQACSVTPPVDESLVVSKGGGVRDIVIYALGDPKDNKVPVKPIHKSYDADKNAKVVFNNISCGFGPHVQKLWTSQTLILKNSDPVGHNTFGSPFNNKAFNPLIPVGGQVEIHLPLAEKIPVKVICAIHPWMKGYVVVRPDPYAAVSKADGSFTIANIPAGKFKFQLWSGALGYLKKVTVGGKALADRKGLHSFTVKKGANDLGDIVIKAKDYARQMKKLGPVRKKL